jgi:putative phosphoesterase
MKIGVLSDTHVPAIVPSLPAAVFEIFKDVELILHAGDIVELSVLDELRAIAPVEAVAGNMDGSDVRRALPFKKVLCLAKFRIGLIHGKFKIPVQREMIRKEFEAVDLIVYGHSHTPFWGVENGVRFLNPGSPTDRVHAPYNSVAILEVGEELKAEIVKI